MYRRRRGTAPLLACTLLLAAACGSDSKGGGDDDGADDGDDGSGGLADGGPAAPDASGPVDADVEVDCPDGNLGALGALANGLGIVEPFDEADPKGAQVRLLAGDFGEDRIFQMALIDQRGAFEGTAVVPGTYEVGEAEASLATCGACITFGLITDETLLGMLPTAGTLTLDAVDTNVTGSVAGLALQEEDPATGTLLEGGCTATVESLSFDVVIAP